MIYQCYPKKQDEASLFVEEPYTGFGLEPDVNKNLFLNCPELEDARARLQLTEYACFLWHWRNPSDNPDEWFGTTSYRQLDKCLFKFTSKNKLSELVNTYGVIGWAEYTMWTKNLAELSLEKHTECCHPGLGNYIEQVLRLFGHEVPPEWRTLSSGFLCNYWVMSRALFDDYMEFSWPMVRWSLENVYTSDYYKTQTTYGTVSRDKATGYLMERLFIFWYLKKGIVPYNPFATIPLVHNII